MTGVSENTFSEPQPDNSLYGIKDGGGLKYIFLKTIFRSLEVVMFLALNMS